MLFHASMNENTGAFEAQDSEEAWAYMVGAREQWLELVYRVCAVMADDNPRFDRARFLKACGIEG